MSLLPERPRQTLFSSRPPARGNYHNNNNNNNNNNNHHTYLRSPTWRTKPYEKPTQPPHPPPPANPDARWNHDLFEDDSNLYGPRVKYQVQSSDLISFGSIRPSPSMRPFGTTPVSPPTTQAVPLRRNAADTTRSNNSVVSQPIKSVICHSLPPKPNSTNSSLSAPSLLSRIQSNNSQKPFLLNDSSTSFSLQHQHQQHQNKFVDPLPFSTLRRPDDQPSNLSQSIIKIQSQNSKNQLDFDLAMAKYLNGPVILEVANLADGTSAEDVKTAFADFGEIQECTTEEGARQGNQPTLKAKMIFTNKGEAEKAVEALNGALADGLTLAVKIIGRPTKKPERADFMTATTTTTTTSSNSNSGNEIKNKMTTADTIVKSQNQEDVTMEDGETSVSPTVPTGRLRSEVVAQCDPRASIQIEPKPISIYKAEQVIKPIIQPSHHQQQPLMVRNMLSRVQPLPNTSHHHHYQQQYSNHHHQQPQQYSNQHQQYHRNGLGNTCQSLLARIKPN